MSSFPKDISLPFTELLLADPTVSIDRISSNRILSGEEQSRFIQVEKEILSDGSCEEQVRTVISDLEFVMGTDNSVSIKNFRQKSYHFVDLKILNVVLLLKI